MCVCELMRVVRVRVFACVCVCVCVCVRARAHARVCGCFVWSVYMCNVVAWRLSGTETSLSAEVIDYGMSTVEG